MKRTAAPQAPGGRGPSPAPAPKKPAEVSNGKASAPLTYSSGEPADDVNMNEVDEKVTLNVFLTSGKSTSVTVDSNIPMLDFLVHLAGRCKVSPSGHELQVREEETGKVLDFKPHQTIGSLGATSVHLLAKNRKPEWSQPAKAVGKAALAFEITQRFTINLPGGQKAVMRVSPQLTLGQVLAKVCQDKSLDTRRYTLQHPSQPHTPLPLHHTIADSKLSEINLVTVAGGINPNSTQRPSASASAAPPPSSSSASAAGVSGSQDPGSWYMPGAGETKKKKGFLSFLSKKEKKFKLDSHHNFETSSVSSQRSASAFPPTPRSTTPPPKDTRPARTDVSNRRPHTMYVTSSSSSSPQGSPREQPRDSPKGQPRSSPRGEERNSPRGPVSAGAAPPPTRGGGGGGGGGGKKRPAPPPPQARAAATAAAATAVSEDVVKASSTAPVAASAPAPTPPETTPGPPPPSLESGKQQQHLSPTQAEVVSVVAVKPGKAGGAAEATTNASSLLHSRNSSDSSGYHELTLSGAESPEAAHHLPTTFKTSIDTTSIDSGDNLNGDSGIQDMASPPPPPPPPAASSSSQEEKEKEKAGATGRGDLSSKYQGEVAPTAVAAAADVTRTVIPSSTKKKKKAPPPPPIAKPAPVQEETTPDVTVDETDSPCAGRPVTPPEGEEPPPPPPPASRAEEVMLQDLTAAGPPQGEEAPPSLKLNLDFLEESDTETEERRAEDHQQETEHNANDEAAAAELEAKEAFDLDDILNSVVFDEEPRRSTINIHTVPRDEEEEEEEEKEKEREAEDREMAMVETGSVVSEEVVVLEDVRSRPCEFIPPPPPDEPPPEDYSPRGSGPRYADKSTVVGEDNVSLAPASLKNSPVSKERRSIPAGKESIDDFQADLTAQLLPDLPLPLPDMLAEKAEDGGVGGGEEDTAKHPSWGVGEQSTTIQGVSDRLGGTSSMQAEYEEDVVTMGSAFAMSEEISAPLETVPPPLQFQTEEDEKEEEEEEEKTVTVTEEYIIPVGPAGLDFSAAVKVSEEEEGVKDSGVHKESRNVFKGVAGSWESDSGGDGGERRGPDSVGEVKKREIESPRGVQQEQQQQLNVVEQKAKPPPPEREEFVLTSEDLSSVSLVPLRPKKYVPPKPAPSPTPAEEKEVVSEASGIGSPQRSHFHLAYVSDRGHVQPVSSSSSTARLSSSTMPVTHSYPNTASHMNTQSSASPPSASSPRQEPLRASEGEGAPDVGGSHKYRSTAKLTMGTASSPEAHPDGGDQLRQTDKSRTSRTSDAPSTESVTAQGAVGGGRGGDVQQQYSTLQQQFTVWQQQLQQNQTLLAAQGGGAAPANDTLKTLQMQMQMQQQMMEQLQRSMQTLSMQQQQQHLTATQPGQGISPHQPPPSTDMVPVIETPPPPPPPVPAPAPAPAPARNVVSRPPAKKVVTQPLSARFQPQLDPREELMIAIRSCGGISGLNTVSVRDTRWTSGNH